MNNGDQISLTNGTGSCGPEWYALYTKHQHEKTVARTLRFKGFDTFLPSYASTRTWKTGKKILQLPLFPCYVFIRGKLERRLDIITTPGIYALVSQAGKPCPIPASEMDAIQRALSSGRQIEPHPLLKCGEWVRIKRGPMAGVEGILARKKNLCRLILSVNMLGKAAAVEIDSSAVERIRGSSAVLANAERNAERPSDQF
jgi:transcription antitermination factor NusG